MDTRVSRILTCAAPCRELRVTVKTVDGTYPCSSGETIGKLQLAGWVGRGGARRGGGEDAELGVENWNSML